MSLTNHSLKTAAILICALISLINCKSTSQPDLVNIQFNECADQLLQGVAAEKDSRANLTIRYDVKDVKQLTFSGLVMDSYVKVGAQNGVVSYYSAETNKAPTAKALLAAMIKKFGEPTTKIRDRQDEKALYWLTSSIYARYMCGATTHNGQKGLSAFIEVASVKALNSGASLGMLDDYNRVKNWNSPEAQKVREGAVTNGPVLPGKSFKHVIKAN